MNNTANDANNNNGFTVNFDYGAIIEEQLLRYSYKGVIVKCIDLPSQSTDSQYYIKFSVPVETETYKIKTKSENGLVNVRNATGEELAQDFIDKVSRMLYGNVEDKEYEFARGMGIIRPKFEWRVRGRNHSLGDAKNNDEDALEPNNLTTDQLLDKAFTTNDDEGVIWTQEMGMEVYIAQKMGMEKIKQMDMDKVMGLKEKIDEFNRVNRIVDGYIEIGQSNKSETEKYEDYKSIYEKLMNFAKEYTKGKLIYEYDELLSFGQYACGQYASGDDLEEIIEWLKSKCMEIREDISEEMGKEEIL